MKLLSIVSAAYGGATYSVLNSLLGLKEKGIEILVITPEKGFLTEELDKHNIPWRIAPIIFS